MKKVSEKNVTQEPLKKSELIAKQKELLELNENLLKEMQEREYAIDLNNRKIFDRLLKFLEKDSPWGHTTATGLVMLYHNLREQKEMVIKAKDWDGKINLRSANVTILWSMVTKMTGHGFHEAKSFIELMAVCGESLSNAVQSAHKDNQQLRENHANLSELDDKLTDPTIINDIEDTAQTVSIASEVDPLVEA
jgi:hypothetical protein